MMLTWSACAHDRRAVSRSKPISIQGSDRWQHLQPVHALIENKAFDRAVQEYQNVLSGSATEEYADMVLFDLGLLYSHYANPKKDYTKSLLCFTRLIKEYPRSPLVEEAKIWANLLETLERTKRVDIELEKKRRR